MLLSHYDRYQYAISPLIETICQLRFPTISSIGTQDPVEFQEAVQSEYPRYNVINETPPLVPGAPVPEDSPAPVFNYSFIAADGAWKLNLTNNFIALSTLRYQRWEDFAQRLDWALSAFIQTYQPTHFERIGLRYVNALSRKNMGVENTPWSELVSPAFLGALAEPDVDEKYVTRCSVDVEMAVENGCRIKLHAGPGLLAGPNGDQEIKFILDHDCSTLGNFTPAQVPERAEALHYHAVRAFRGAVTSELHTAMGAGPLR